MQSGNRQPFASLPPFAGLPLQHPNPQPYSRAMILTAPSALALRLRRPGFRTALESGLLLGWIAWLAITIGRFAAIRPLWYDELFTLHLAQAPLADLLGHLAAGVDLNPPLVYLVTKGSLLLLGETPLAVRLPALLGLGLGLVCLYAFLRRHVSAPTALLAAAASVASVKVWVYFLEGRPYGLVFGFAALALLAWQRAAEHWRWRAALALAAVLGVSSHYYFVVALAALAWAEMLRWFTQRRFDWRPMLLIALGGLTLLAWQPLWSVAPRDYAAGFWAKVSFDRPHIQTTLGQFLEPSLIIPALLATLLAFLLQKREALPAAPPFADTAALIALALTPVLGLWIGSTFTGGFFFRYVLFATLAFGALFALALDRVASRPLPLLLAFAGFAGFGLPVDRKPYREFFRHEAATLANQRTFLEQHCAGAVVVIETGFEFGRLWYGNPRSFRPHFLADPEAARAQTQVDTTERALQKLRAVTPVPVLTCEELTRRRAAGEPLYYYGPATAWGYRELQSRGVRFVPIAEQDANRLFRLR